MKIIELSASIDALTASVQTIGCAGDHLSTVLKITPEKDLQGAENTYRLAFQTADGYRCLTDVLPLADGVLTFALPNVLMVEGQLQVQLIVYQNEVITHTPKSTALTVLPSIGATTEIPPDYTGLIYPGVGIVSTAIVDNRLIVRYQDGREQDAGEVSPTLPHFTVELSDTWQMIDFEEKTIVGFRKGTLISSGQAINLQSAPQSPVLLNGVQAWASATDGYGMLRKVVDPVEATDVANKQYVDRTVLQNGNGWTALIDASFEEETDQTVLMLPMDTAVAHMSDFKLAIILPQDTGISTSAFYVKAFFTDEEVSATNLLLSRGAVAVSAGGKLMVAGTMTRMGEGLLYTTETAYAGTASAKTPYTAIQYFDVSLLQKTPCLRLTLSNGYTFPAGTQIVLQGR